MLYPHCPCSLKSGQVKGSKILPWLGSKFLILSKQIGSSLLNNLKIKVGFLQDFNTIKIQLKLNIQKMKAIFDFKF